MRDGRLRGTGVAIISLKMSAFEEKTPTLPHVGVYAHQALLGVEKVKGLRVLERVQMHGPPPENVCIWGQGPACRRISVPIDQAFLRCE